MIAFAQHRTELTAQSMTRDHLTDTEFRALLACLPGFMSEAVVSLPPRTGAGPTVTT